MLLRLVLCCEQRAFAGPFPRKGRLCCLPNSGFSRLATIHNRIVKLSLLSNVISLYTNAFFGQVTDASSIKGFILTAELLQNTAFYFIVSSKFLSNVHLPWSVFKQTEITGSQVRAVSRVVHDIRAHCCQVAFVKSVAWGRACSCDRRSLGFAGIFFRISWCTSPQSKLL
jgi:hypothetical protein